MRSTRKTASISQVAKLLFAKERVALFLHTNPDGDAIGASVALALSLQRAGKTVGVFCDMPIGDKITSSFTETKIISDKFSGKYDLMVAVDCGDANRLGKFSAAFCNFAETLTIDHHGGEYYSAYNLVLQYASSCQIVYEVLRQSPVEIDDVIATYLYMGLCTDTGNFSHNYTDRACFLTAADLCSCGADMERVNRVFFKDTTLTETRLLARALSHMRIFYDGQMVLLYLTQTDLKEFDADLGDTSGIVQYAINVDTAKIGVMLTECSPHTYKVSMRGKDFPVRDVCRQFGGGGHLYASGCMLSGFLEDVIEKIVRTVGFSI